jgi:hypothetical protein
LVSRVFRIIRRESTIKKSINSKKLSDDPDLPQEVTIVQFGPNESKKISDHHYYEQCIDKDIGQTPNKKFSIKFLFSKIVRFAKNLFGNLFGNEDDSTLGDTPGFLGEYGQLSCNHSNIVTNQQFLDYIKKLMTSYTSNVVNKEVIDLKINESGIKQLIYECYPVTCHGDYDACFDSFMKLVYE